MKRLHLYLLCIASYIVFVSQAIAQPPAQSSAVAADEAAIVAAIRANEASLAKSFNAGNADEVARFFLANGELIDEIGNIYQGQSEVKSVLTSLFEQYPGTVLTLNIESIRVAGPVVVEEELVL